MTIRLTLRALAFTAIGYSLSMSAHAQEFGGNNAYYEDDAWYDVTEWFDGNDYNPTDEAIGRWDNETFEFADNATSDDADNDWETNWGEYRYNNQTADSDRWFYDYYDDGYGHWGDYRGWNSYSLYNDANNDGLYDSYSFYRDSDGDGLYDDYTYYNFDSNKADASDSKSQVAAQDRQKSMKSGSEQVSGTVEKTKMANVRDRVHLIATVKATDGKMVTIDLGPKQSSTQLFKGDQLSATGHRVKVGDKELLVATSAKSKDADVTIDRNGRKYQGTVESTREISLRGQKHLLAKVKTQEGKSMMVDMGPASQLSSQPKDGSKITVQGVPVKIKDRVVLMARSVEQDGKTMDIQRAMEKSKG